MVIDWKRKKEKDRKDSNNYVKVKTSIPNEISVTNLLYMLIYILIESKGLHELFG
jgi:hypothetical protein